MERQKQKLSNNIKSHIIKNENTNLEALEMFSWIVAAILEWWKGYAKGSNRFNTYT